MEMFTAREVLQFGLQKRRLTDATDIESLQNN
jgi:hypothetical protein